jgi:predicted adenine nucleotide alpha hydrolase (AANH) superfamily ATPase
MCCAPCAVYVVQRLQEIYEVAGFFYNPNIHPQQEYEFRKKEIEKIARELDWTVFYGDYDMKEWFRLVKGLEKEPERGRRCSLCFHMRLRQTFELASREGFGVVASTLSISPYKATRQINAEGVKLAEAFGIRFLPENFKKQEGYRIGRRMALGLGIRHQDYCGCAYSKAERILKTAEGRKRRG